MKTRKQYMQDMPMPENVESYAADHLYDFFKDILDDMENAFGEIHSYLEVYDEHRLEGIANAFEKAAECKDALKLK